MIRLLHRPREQEWGSATLEIAVLGPALLLLIFTLVQVGLWYHARSLALAAAQEGVAAGRAYGAGSSVGVDRARTFLDRAAGDSVRQTSVSPAGSSTTRIRIQVQGQSLSVLPGLPGVAVRQAAEAPVERFTVAGAP
jgi:Flp pilus assembly protein TadG